MAGAAIFGVITACLRTPDLGSPIRHISVGVDFTLVDGVLREAAHEWYEGFHGQIVGLVVLVSLGVVCYFLARLGAKWQTESDNSEE